MQLSPISQQIRHTSDFTPLFYPRTVAIIGASQNKVGGVKYLFALQTSGFIANGGKVFLINPKYKELFGQPVYPNLDDPVIPKPIDLVIISVSAPLVPKIIQQLDANKARFATIFTSGFAESDKLDLDKELKTAISHSSTRYIGPNCLGILNPVSKISIYPEWPMTPGSISYIAQSGGTMARLYIYLGSLGVGFHNVVSIGNMYDIDASELLHHFAQDEKTKTIALYLESIRNAQNFMAIAKEVTKKKPVILWKGGQSQRGQVACVSHTGGLAGSFEVWKGMARQCGMMIANYFEQFSDLVQVATIRPIPPKNKNVAILVAGGGIGIEFTDILEAAGFSICDLEPRTVQALGEVFPDVNTNFKNPIDLGEYGYEPRLFARAMRIVLKDQKVGSIVFVREPERFRIISKLMDIPDPQKLTIDSITEVLKEDNGTQKPVLCNPSANKESVEMFSARWEFQKAMIQAGLPVINYIANIPHVLNELYQYGLYLERNRSAS